MQAIQVTLNFGSMDELLRWAGNTPVTNVVRMEMLKGSVPAAQEPAAPKVNDVADADAAAEEVAEEAAEEAATVEYTREAVEKAVRALLARDGMAAVHTVLREYNAARISDIKTDDYAAVVAACTQGN